MRKLLSSFFIKLLLISGCAAAQDIDDGRYVIVSRYSGKALNVADSSQENGANITQWEYQNSANQQFDVTHIGNDFYSIRPVHSGKSLDVFEFSTSPGGEIRQWEYWGGDNQLWSISSAEDGYHTITSKWSGLSLDVWEWSLDNGGEIRQWTPTGGVNQQWKFEPAPSDSTDDTACTTLDKRWHQTIVNLDSNANPAPNNEYTPAIISPLPSGESLLAWTDASTQNIRMIKLDQDDQRVATLPNLAGLEVHDIIPTGNGFALAVMDNDPDIYSPKYCRGSTTPDNAVCGKMDLVLLNTQGELVSRTTLTDKTNVDSAGTHFIWWYGHTARLATDGNHIGAYFRSAQSTDRPGEPGEVDIHAGDTLKFVDANSGALVNGGWDWGCSHSWSVRLASNGTTWGATCHGDAFPNAMQLSRLMNLTASSEIGWLDNTDPAQRALGGLVAAEDGFWMNYLQMDNSQLTMKLGKFTDSLNTIELEKTITVASKIDSGYPFRVYMAAYGQDQLLMGWKSGGQLVIAVADAETGEIMEGPVATTLDIDNFQDMKTSTDGDVIWSFSTGSGQRISVNRIESCK